MLALTNREEYVLYRKVDYSRYEYTEYTGEKWWAVAESNCGHEAFQASALPAELTAREENYNAYFFLLSS